MTINAGDIAGYVSKSAKRDRLEFELRGTVSGGAGVVLPSAIVSDDPALNIVRGGSAGLYNLTFPKSADALGFIDVLLISLTGAVKGWYCVGADFAAGTASIQTINAAGAATDPATTDTIVVSFMVSCRRDL